MSVKSTASGYVETTYARQELMVITAARALRGCEVVLVGIGLPNLACNLARRLHAPGLELVYEAGVCGAAPERLPLSIGDPGLVSGAASVCSLPDVFLLYLQRGLIDVGFLGAAQIDRFGNLNTTVIGDYCAPKVRLPGSGGACDIALMARRVFVIARQTPEVFVEGVDFVTSPGFVNGRRPEGASGLGPQLVITDLATYRFDEDTGQMRVASMHPGVSFDEIQAATGWPIQKPVAPHVTPGPTTGELKVLREEVDVEGHYLAR